MTQTNPNQHYRLSLEQARLDHQDGIITTTGLIYYAIGILRKPGHKLRVKDIEVFCAELTIGVSTFYKAISKLKQSGRINWNARSGIELWIPIKSEVESGSESSLSLFFDDCYLDSSAPDITDDFLISKSYLSLESITPDKEDWEGLDLISKCRLSKTEHQIRDRLYLELGGEIEVITTVGRIDLLTTTEVIEIKNINVWKNALGQILAYGAFFPNHRKRIHLFGRPDLTKLALAQATCLEFGVNVTFEEV